VAGITALQQSLGRRSRMATSEQYQRFAQECLEIARAAKDERARATLIHMAQVWLRLAADQAKVSDAEKSD
jgi:hypothetical protein